MGNKYFKPKIAIFLTQEMKSACISDKDWQRLNAFSEVIYSESETTPEIVSEIITEVDACLTGWGTPVFSKKSLDSAPKLKLIAHSAGSVKDLLEQVKDTIIQKEIQVSSAVASLGIGVAEFTLGMMLMTMKRTWKFTELTRQGQWRKKEEQARAIEPYDTIIGIIAASNIGRHFIKLLQAFDVKIIVYDPYISDIQAKELGAKKVSLEELMRTSDVVSVHAPQLAQTKHMINKNNLKLMKDGAILINTARGSIINEADLIAELKTARITACLDVTDPEPPLVDSPLRSLPNVILTPHIAGAIAQNRFRNGKYAIDDLENFFCQGSILHPVDLRKWDILA
jgi:phosphoglycerate dehydrogenase-like enzyme